MTAVQASYSGLEIESGSLDDDSDPDDEDTP
jgi:hypothetical protein